MKLPLSVFIITCNEEARIGMVIEAVRDWVDEVVVADSGSTDRTIEIVEGLGAKVFHRDWEGFGQQKRFAEDQCRNNWLLNIDADEVVPASLRGEIEELFAQGEPPCDGYKLKIHYIYPGDHMPRPMANDYNVVRLYNRSAGRYRDHSVFDRVVMHEKAKLAQLASPLAHYALLSWTHMMDKANESSSHNLDKLVTRPTWVLKFRLFFGFPLNFWRNYLLRGHFLGGAKGFIFSLSTAWGRTMRIAKALEIKELQRNVSKVPDNRL